MPGKAAAIVVLALCAGAALQAAAEDCAAEADVGALLQHGQAAFCVNHRATMRDRALSAGQRAALHEHALRERALRREAVDELRAALGAGIDWDTQNKLAPWLTSIEEGSDQAVGIVCGQSLNPDGSAPQVLKDRALMARKLLEEGTVTKLVVSGGDPAGVGHTEASEMAKVLEANGIPKEKIIQEAQATTTAENAWFMLRWIPKGTGKVYIITSDFHIARATYIFTEVFNFFYRMVEDTYKDDERWNSTTRRYPRLAIKQAPTQSYCGSEVTKPDSNINTQSLAERARNELGYLGTGEVPTAMFGPPVNTLNDVMYVWPIQINVTADPENPAAFQKAMAQAMNAAAALCVCVGSTEQVGPAVEPYPLAFPISSTFPPCMQASDWKKICPK